MKKRNRTDLARALLQMLSVLYWNQRRLSSQSYLWARSLLQRKLHRLRAVLLHILKKAQHISFKVICLAALLLYRHISSINKKKLVVDSVLHISIISSKQYMLSRLLRRHGIRSAFLALNTDLVDRLTLGYDYSIPFFIHPAKRRLLELYYLWFILARYDVIHFHFNVLLSLDNGWEMEYLKQMGKILVFHFRGCDLRQRSINMEKNPSLNCCLKCDYPKGSCDTDYQRMRIAKAKVYGDLFFCHHP